MERFITLKDSDFKLQIRLIYNGIYSTVKDASYLHFTTAKTNNGYHFESVLNNANETIKFLLDFFHPEDERRKEFKLIDGDYLLQEAKEFFERDVY